MNGIFRMDGPLYRIGNALYYLMITNLLWVVFSIPIFTVGSSTTALFYVMGKVVRDEDVSVFKDFWKSFKTNFKQGTIVWLVMLLFIFIINTNIRSMPLLGDMAKYIMPLQYAILIEIFILSVYIFPLISRYEMKTKDLIRTSFFLGNRHIFTTLLCLAMFTITLYPIVVIIATISPAIIELFIPYPLIAIFAKFNPEVLNKTMALFVILGVSLYALFSYYLVFRIFKKYMPQEKKKRELQEDYRDNFRHTGSTDDIDDTEDIHEIDYNGDISDIDDTDDTDE